MGFIHNFPFFSIVIPMFSGIISLVLSSRLAKIVCFTEVSIVTCLSGVLLYREILQPESFIYYMGHFPAPWGNEIRGGVIEAFLAFFFSLLLLLCLVGGIEKSLKQIEDSKENMFFILTNLLLSSLMALVYTNDMFTAYVFIEINTIAACGLIMIRPTGQGILSAIRYMVMSSVGSGLFLLALCMLYGITGHLLMSNIYTSVQEIYANGTYMQPLTVIIGFMIIGLGIKSALFPFHTWVPDSYGNSTVGSSAMLSSLVSKAYIVLLIKIIYRVIGIEVVRASGVLNIIFVFALIGMLWGSVCAIRTDNVRRMISFSSVAQIGYIYMGIGLGTTLGMTAAIFHIVSHGFMKALLFISAGELADSDALVDLKITALHGARYRHRIASSVFVLSSLSMVGIPFLSGFGSKFLFAVAGVTFNWQMYPALICLAISTVLNAMYFLRTCIHVNIASDDLGRVKPERGFVLGVFAMCAVIVILGVLFAPVSKLIETGINMLA